MKHSVVGIDIAKRVFQLHWIDIETGEIVSLQFKREKFLEHFANRQACLIGMEACGGAQHWARELIELGHQVKLLSGKLVKSFVMGNKGDVADARAIWTAVQQPGIKPIAIKTEQQQAILALHRMRPAPGQDTHHAGQRAAGLAHRIRRGNAARQGRFAQRDCGRA